MTRRHALITGGAGFIGSHLADVLIERGFQVTVLDSLAQQVHADAELDGEGWPVYLNRAARRIRGDILEPGLFEHSLSGVTHLVHLAASVGVGQSMTNIIDYTRNNVMAAAVILQALSKTRHAIERIAVASSMSIYGEGAYVQPSSGLSLAPELRSHEQLRARRWELEHEGEMLAPAPTTEAKRLQPASIYAINKRDHEEMFLAVGRALEIPTVALRLFNAYGSRQALSNPYTGVAAIFISRLLNNQPPLVFEDGAQQRDFVHVLDVADAFAAVLESDLVVWDSYNVGSGRAVTIAEVAGTLARLLRKNIAPEMLNRYRVGDVRHCFPALSKIERTFGVRPKRDFEVGMEELIAWVERSRRPADRAEQSLRELSENRLVV